MTRALLAALLIAVAGALIWGFTVVGGPAFARMEQNDRIRTADLRRLGEYYRCANYTLTESDRAISPGYCGHVEGPAPDAKDPVSDAPYRYAAEGNTYFEVCATFEVPAEHRRDRDAGVVFDGQNGCITYYRDNDTAKWRLGPID